MLRVPGINFRNVLLCVAITLQFLTYMKHNGVGLIELPSSPVPSFASSPLRASHPAHHSAHTGARPSSTESATASSVPVAGVPFQQEGGKPPVSGGKRRTKEPTLQPASPKGSTDSGGRTKTGLGNPQPPAPTTQPTVPVVTQPTPPADPGPTDPGDSGSTGDGGAEAGVGGEPEAGDDGEPEAGVDDGSHPG